MAHLLNKKQILINGKKTTPGKTKPGIAPESSKNGVLPAITKLNKDFIYFNEEHVTSYNLNEFEKPNNELLINFTDDLFWSLSSDFKLITANNAFIKDLQDLVNITFKPGDYLLMKQVFPKEFLEFWEQGYKKALAGESFKKELYTPAFNKRKASWTETTFNPVHTDNVVNGIACFSRNITEEKITKEKIRQSEIRLSEAQQVAKIGSWETDLETFNVIWSLETYRIFEIDPHSFQASHPAFLEFIHPDDREKVDGAFINSLNGNSVNTIDHRIVTATGIIKIVEERWRIFHDIKGNPARAAGTCQDITERKNTEEKMRGSEVRYRSLIEQAIDAICITDSSMNIIDINSRGCQMLGYTKAEFLKLTITDLFIIDDLKTNPLKIDKLKIGNIISNERKFKRKNGTTVEVEINARLLEDGKFVVFAHDITERKKAEKELQSANHEKITILESIDDGFFAIDKNSLVTYWNRKAEELLGQKKGDVIGRNLHEMFANSDSKIFYDNYQKAIRENGTVHFEGFSVRSNKWFAVSAFASDNGLSVHFKDVTERKAFEEKVKVSELRYRSLVEQATDTICIFDTSFKFTEINPIGCQMFGYSKEEILNLFMSDVLFEEDLKNNPIQMEVLKAGKTISNERRIKRKDGSSVELEINGKMLEGGRIMIFGRDISERKAAEQKLKQSEAKYRTLFEQNMAGVYQSTAKGVILNCNNAFAKMLKYDSPKEILKINASELYFSHAERNDFCYNALTKKKINNYESVLKCKDGSPLYFVENISLRKDEMTGETIFEGIMIDITEQKFAELELKQSNERYNLISRATNDMVWDWDLVTGKVYRNREGWKKLFRTGDKKIEKELMNDWNDRIHPEDQYKVKQIKDEIKGLDKDFFEVECRMLRDDGSYVYIHDRGNIIRDAEGTAVRLIGATQDITQRKEAEFHLAKSEMLFRSLVQNSSDLTGIIDEKGYFLHSSLAIKKILGYEPEFMVGKNVFFFVHPDDIISLRKHMSAQNEDYSKATKFRFKNAQGAWRWLESKVTDMSKHPEVNGYIFNARDVTERKIAEAEIEKLSFIARETGNSVIITNPQGEIVWVNEGFTKITEFKSEEVIGKTPGSVLQGGETNLTVVRYMRKKLKNKEAFECDILNYSKSGRKFWLRIQCQPQFNETGKLKYFFAIETDITKEKEAEEILRASEERYRYLFDNNPANIFIWDLTNFKILEINNTAIQSYNYSRKEFLSSTIFNLCTPEYHDKIKQFVSKARQQADFKFDNICEHINKTGEKMFMSINSHRIEFKGRSVILALATNITDRVKLEKELEKEKLLKHQEITKAVISAQEQERQELGGELHDNVNQILAGSLLYLGLAKRELNIDHPYLIETDTLINTAIEEIRNLSHSLIPPSLNESEFLEALKNIIEVTQKTSGIIINLQAFGFNESNIHDKLKLTIYRIVQEQFNNILKHARSQKVIVRLVQENEKTLLSVKDDGVGFDTTKKANGVGLLNIKTRASLFNGDVSIISSPGKGCELRVLFN